MNLGIRRDMPVPGHPGGSERNTRRTLRRLDVHMQRRMEVNITKLLAAVSAVTLCGAASAQGLDTELIVIEGNGAAPALLSSDEEPNGDLLFCDLATTGEGECDIVWQNGDPDNLFAVRSADPGVDSPHRFFAADDFILHPCRWNYYEAIELVMAIGDDVVDPQVELRIYPDCDGKPDKTVDPEVYQGLVCEGVPSVAFSGFQVHRIRFELDWWKFGDPAGCERYWIVPVGTTVNTKYFWISTDVGADDQRVQGVQGHFKAPTTVPAYPEWTPYEDYCPDPSFPDCAGDCIDFNFHICGKICALLKDQSEYDLQGEAATKFPNVNDTGISADNFQVHPAGRNNTGGRVELCRIEAWLATNCNPDLVYGLIFENFCDKPGDERNNLGFVDYWEATGETFDGLPVYKFVWFCTGVNVRKGRNYWFAPLASRGVSIAERSVWLFRQRAENCKDIWIQEGCYMNWNDIDPNFYPVSDFTPMNVQRDFAFKIWLVDDNANGSVPQGDPGETYNAADIDRNGSVGLEDLQLLLFNFGATTP